MGLDILIKYSSEDDKDDYSYAFHVGYGDYHSFMEEILRFFSFKSGIIPFYYSRADLPGCPETDLSKLKIYENDPNFTIYKNSILEFEKEGLLDLVPLVLHSDCDGFISWENAKNILELLDKDEIKLWFKLESEWDEKYEILIDTLRRTVENKALIVYS